MIGRGHRLSVETKVKFLERHYIIAKPALISNVRDYRIELIKLARKELGYSKNTTGCDILMTLERVFRWKYNVTAR